MFYIRIIIYIAIIFVVSSCGESNTRSTQIDQESNTVAIAKIDTIYSSVLNESIQLHVHVPHLYKSYYKPISYPVIYVLDPDAHFLSVVSMMDKLSVNVGEERAPQCIIVGVNSNDRMRDMFPISEVDSFHLFMEDELKPYIGKEYPTQSYNAIVGHSLTGLRVIHSAVNHMQAFDAYVAIDPSLCHNNCTWRDNNSEKLFDLDLKNKKLFMAMAQSMPKGMDTTTIMRDTSGLATHMQSMIKFANSMSANNSDNEFAWKYYPNESHNSVTFSAIWDGLNHIFKFYRFQSYDKLFDESTSPSEAVAMLDNHYKFVSEQLGYEELPSEYLVGTLSYYLGIKGQINKAVAFAKKNVEYHPKSEQAKSDLKYLLGRKNDNN